MTEFVNRKYPLQTMSDTIFEVLCSQISADYTSIIRSEILPEVSQHGDIGVREIRVLLLIDLQEDVTSSAMIADTLRFDPGTVTRASKRLVSAGLAERVKSMYDKRSIYFKLTDIGQNLADKYRSHIRNRYIQLESESDEFLSHEDRNVIFNALVRLRSRSEELARTDKRLPRNRT